MATPHGSPMEAEEIETSNRTLPPGDIEFLRQFVTAAAPNAILMIDRESHVIAASDRFHEDFDLICDHTLGRPLDDLFQDRPSRWNKALARVLSGETLKCTKDYYLGSDGSKYWLHWEAMPYRDASGVIGGCIIFIEKLNNEIETAKNLSLVLKSAKLGVWERDLVLNKLHLSEQAEALVGYSPGTFGEDPQTLDTCLHPDDAAHICEATESAIHDKSPVTLTFRVIWPDGSTHWLRATCESEHSPEGTPILLRGVSLDITETQEQEITLKALTADLEKKVKERTQELEIATEAKSRFLANMSHEIRNPLNSVTILSKLLEREDLDSEKRKEFVRRITTATNTVTQILDEILDFSKLEAGQTLLESVPFNLNDILDDLRALFEARAEAKEIKLDIAPTTCHCVLLGDQNRIKQILGNLIGNAIKFTPKGSVLVKTRHKRLNQNLLGVVFEITDTGIGIDPESLPTLFQPFTQGDSSITRKYGGTGLGLSISRNLAILMGGEIEARSTPGLGSTFKFSLNIPIEENCNRNEKAATILNDNTCLKGLRLLVVDDDVSNTEIMCEFLNSHGATTVAAFNGVHALEQIERSPEAFDIVLMDIQMPIMDGIEASRRIRNELHLETLPIIAVTAGVLPHQQEEAILAGITELIRKPVDHLALIKTLLRHGPRRD